MTRASRGHGGWCCNKGLPLAVKDGEGEGVAWALAAVTDGEGKVLCFPILDLLWERAGGESARARALAFLALLGPGSRCAGPG